jgi:RimJ/RimL family protein N-acetyltransferase
VEELKQGFNRLSDKVRVVAILSPTCDACQRGRGLVSELFKNQASERLAGLVVWLPMKPKDSPEAAHLESENLTDERVSVRGWDNERQIGNLFAKPLKLSSTAWDVYLVYAPGIKWKGKQPPKPSYWMHQLQGQRADTMLCLNPAALSAQVERFLAQESKSGKSQVDSTRISFYAVPLVCGAAPEIGCGSRAKPILQALERNSAVAQAWLNRAGTVIAVLWSKDSTEGERPIYEWSAHSDAASAMMGPPTYPDHPIPTWEQFCEDHTPHFFDGSAPHLGRCFIILVNNEPVGQVYYNDIEEHDGRKRTELDVWMRSELYCGQGFGSDALLTLCEYLTRYFGVQEFMVQPSARNPRAIRAYEKIGFARLPLTVEEAREQWGPNDYFDSVYMVKRVPPDESASNTNVDGY